MDEHIIIGKILKSQGVKGQLKVLPITANPERFYDLIAVYTDDDKKRLDIAEVKVREGFVYLNFEGVTDKNEADLLKDKYLSIKKENAIVLPDNAWFISDLVGCIVVLDTGEELGELVEVLQNGSADVYVVSGKKKLMFPALNDLLLNVDIANKKITLDSQILSQVCVYDD